MGQLRWKVQKQLTDFTNFKILIKVVAFVNNLNIYVGKYLAIAVHVFIVLLKVIKSQFC